MTIRHIALLGVLSFALVGCKANVQTDTTIQTPQETTQPETENMMQGTETPVATPVDVSTDASLKSAATLKSSDDATSLKADLDSTTVLNEDFK